MVVAIPIEEKICEVMLGLCVRGVHLEIERMTIVWGEEEVLKKGIFSKVSSHVSQPSKFMAYNNNYP